MNFFQVVGEWIFYKLIEFRPDIAVIIALIAIFIFYKCCNNATMRESTKTGKFQFNGFTRCCIITTFIKNKNAIKAIITAISGQNLMIV